MKTLKYGDIIKFPFQLYRNSYNHQDKSLVDCVIEVDHVLPNNEKELDDSTYKVTIIPVEQLDSKYPQRIRTYFSDLKQVIIEHNPEYTISNL